MIDQPGVIDVKTYLTAHGMDRLVALDRPVLLTFNKSVHDQLLAQLREEAQVVEPAHGGGFFDCRVNAQPLRVFCSGDGGAAAAFATEILIARQAPRILGIGMAASIAPNRVAIGDFVVPCGVIRGDGVSRAYLPDTLPVVQDPVTVSGARSVLEEHGVCACGLACSVDSYFTTTEATVATWVDTGGITLDMEAAGFLAVCRVRHQPALLVQVASAAIHDRVWNADQPKANQTLRRFVAALPSLLDLLHPATGHERNLSYPSRKGAPK